MSGLSKFAWVFAPPALLIAAVLLQPWFEPRWAFLDPIVAGQTSGYCCRIYYGVLSNVGVLYWWAAASVCCFTALLLHRIGDRSRDFAFIACAGVFTALLSVDDLLMLHEGLLPKLGIPQPVVLAFYAAAGLTYVVGFRSEILARDAAIFALATAFLCTSLVIDVFVHSLDNVFVWMEDGAKFMGVAGWSGFHILRAHALCQKGTPDQGSMASPKATRSG